MRNFFSFALVSMLATTAVVAAPGVTTISVNFRSGPGTNYSSIRTLETGSTVDVGDCDESSKWCAVTVGEKKVSSAVAICRRAKRRARIPKAGPVPTTPRKAA